MKVKYNGYDLEIIKDNYLNGALYLGLLDKSSGEMYCDITTNLEGYTDRLTIAIENSIGKEYSAIVNKLLKKYEGFKLASISNGFNTYTLYTLLNAYGD